MESLMPTERESRVIPVCGRRYIYGVYVGVGLILAAKLTAAGICFVLGKVCHCIRKFRICVGSMCVCMGVCVCERERERERERCIPRTTICIRISHTRKSLDRLMSLLPAVHVRGLGELDASTKPNFQDTQKQVRHQRFHARLRLAPVTR